MKTMMSVCFLFLCACVIFLLTSCTSVSVDTLGQVRAAAIRVVPAEAKVEVFGSPRAFAKPSIVISAHLLEGTIADDNSPYVRGDYGTHEKLLRLVKLRCARVFASVFQSDANLEEASEIVIRVRHGVRQYYGAWSGRSSDVPQTIFEVSLSVTRGMSMGDKLHAPIEMEKFWREKVNIIPHLRFQVASYNVGQRRLP